MFVSFLLSALVGFGIGLLSGLLGVGGGVVMVPVFRLVYGLSALSSTATSLFTIIPTSLTGALTHVRGKTCVPKLGVALGLGGACLSPVGVWLAQISPSWMVMLGTALAVGYSAITMIRKAMKTPARQKAGDAFETPSFTTTDMAKAVAVGAAAGAASGYIGLGGGFIMVPLMVSAMGMPMRLASGTSLIAVMILALPATVMQCLLGNVDYLVGVAVACGSIPGALVGARLVARMPERALRFVFAGFLGVAAILLVVKEVGLLA